MGAPVWFRRCANPQALAGMYDRDEGLERVRPVEVSLRDDGPHLHLRADLARFPERPPARWDPEASVVQVAVSFWFVRDVVVRGWSGDAAGALTLTPEGDGLRLELCSDGLRLEARCLSARIDRVGAYAVWPDDEGLAAPGNAPHPR